MLSKNNFINYGILAFLFVLEFLIILVFKKDSQYEVILIESFFLLFFIITLFILNRFIRFKIEYTGFAFLGLMLLKIILTVLFITYLISDSNNQRASVIFVLIAYFKYLFFSILIAVKLLNSQSKNAIK